MLNATIFNVLNKILDGNLESVEYYYSGGHKLQLMTKSEISYEDFIKKTKYIILEKDIGSHDSDDNESMISIDLTEEFINKIIAFVRFNCLDEFENMKRSR